MTSRPEALVHLFPKGITTPSAFTAPRPRRSSEPPTFPQRPNPAAHARRLLGELATTGATKPTLDADRKKALLEDVEGMFVDVKFVPNKDFPLHSLEDLRAGIEVVAVTDLGPELAQATLFVPDGQLRVLEAKIKAFAPLDPTKAPRNKALVSSIEAIRRAVVESFWTDPLAPFPADRGEHWWEIWTRRGVAPERFRQHAKILKLHVADRQLRFPDRTVFLVRASIAKITLSADLLDSIAELRRATSLDLEMIGVELETEQQLTGDIRGRSVRPPDAAPAVCLLDTGVDFDHPLLQTAIDRADAHTCFGEDRRDRYGTGDWHGTGSAGLAVYGLDLASALFGRDQWRHTHHLESVKYIPSSGQNAPDLYGELTKEAVARAEIAQPDRPRVIVTTVTAQESPRGEPTSWSAAIDQLSSGYDDEERTRRLVVLAAGNVLPETAYEYPDSNHLALLEDPAQAWNAIAVGAYTERDVISEAGHEHCSCIAGAGDLSPTSRTTVSWDTAGGGSPPPFKPDFVCEGGNWAVERAHGFPLQLDSLSLLTTRRRDGIGSRVLGRFSGTSSAAPLAARMAARLQGEYPTLWPETIRALLVHSCRYTDAMEACFANQAPRRRAERLLRCFGYGVPDLDRARYSARNELTLVVEHEIQPFRVDLDDRKGKTNEMHLHRIPWPSDLLEALGELETRLRVTLSYFVEPNPGKRGVSGTARTKIVEGARYPSFGLRFSVTTPGESPERIVARVNAAARDEGTSFDESDDLSEWRLGRIRTRGSLHSDVWTGTAAKLADKGSIVVFPVNGWWRFHARDANTCERSARYALVVSIETDAEEVDVYTPVENQIALTR